MIELFGASGTVEGNPELMPEEGTSTDVGVAVDLGVVGGSRVFLPAVRSARAEVVLFRAKREDLITFLQNSQRTVKAFNLESAEVVGAELSASVSVGRTNERADVTVAYTWQDARNTGPSPVYNDKRLPYEPEHSLFVRTELARAGVRAWHEYRFEGESYRDRANLPENLSPARHLHDVGAAVGILDGLLTLRAEVANLMDERLTDVEGYPLPGRTYTIGIEVSRDWEDER
jgi:iron complex outermembrane receptor protein